MQCFMEKQGVQIQTLKTSSCTGISHMLLAFGVGWDGGRLQPLLPSFLPCAHQQPHMNPCPAWRVPALGMATI